MMQVVLSLEPGGTERLVIEICRRLAPAVDTLVCCLDEPGAWAGELALSNIPVIALHRKAGFRPMLGLRLARLAAEHGANVLHCHQYSPFVYGRIATVWNRNLKLVFTEHGRLSDAPPSVKRRVANRFLGRGATATCAVSADLRSFMVEEGFPQERIRVVYNGIDLAAPARPDVRLAVRQSLGLAPDTFVVGTVARLDPVKDLHTLLEAATLARRPLTLLIVGDGSERTALERRAEDLGITSVTRFLGHRGDVRRILSAFDVFVNCSTSEGISLTILEAMASSLPVIATRVGGTPEVVVDEESGLLVPARSADVLAKAIDRLAASPADRFDFGAAGRLRVERRFSLDRMVGDYLNIYEELRAS
jgi:glycosyltransferase involved in cell wall biosynthesis